MTIECSKERFEYIIQNVQYLFRGTGMGVFGNMQKRALDHFGPGLYVGAMDGQYNPRTCMTADHMMAAMYADRRSLEELDNPIVLAIAISDYRHLLRKGDESLEFELHVPIARSDITILQSSHVDSLADYLTYDYEGFPVSYTQADRADIEGSFVKDQEYMRRVVPNLRVRK